MGAPHGHRLHFHAHSPVHALSAHTKLIALLAYAVLVVATPAQWWWMFAVWAVAILSVIAVSKVPVSYLAPRMLVEAPFVVFALVVPFVATGPRVQILGMSLSQAGLTSAAILLTKGTLGVLASLTLAATTEPHDLIAGLRRLRFPKALVDVIANMLRYLDVVTTELTRMRVALTSRGFTARNPRHWAVIARSLGALFVRAYERGERVHLAMLSRGAQ